MSFVGNLLLFAAVQEFCKSIKLLPWLGWHPFLTHGASLGIEKQT